MHLVPFVHMVELKVVAQIIIIIIILRVIDTSRWFLTGV